jgi:hypothetical protein
MNKTTTIIIVVIVLILLGGGAFFFLNKSSHNPVKSVQQSVQNQVAKMTTEHKSLADFFSMTGSQKCTFTDKTNNSSGTLYIGDNKMRGDFQATDNGKTTQTHMINDGTYVYLWIDGQKDGYKMSTAKVKNEAAQVSTAPGEQVPSQAQVVDMKQKADYSCGPWSVDATMFTLPQGVTFTDFSSMMQGATPAPARSQGMTDEQKQSMCAQCNKVPAGAMRNQCLTQLKCQ